MYTKERRRASVGLLCVALLLTAMAFRLADAAKNHRWQASNVKIATVLSENIEETEATYPTLLYTPVEWTSPKFSLSEVGEITNRSGKSFDAAALLAQATPFERTSEPMVLIVHTHATEAYADAPDYRSTDAAQNVLRVGQALADRLNANGIATLHDTTLIDRMGYSESYAHAAEVIEEYLREYPSIQMVIDVHRDAVADENGTQLAMKTTINGQAAAQLLLVMGTDGSGLTHPNWQGNLAFALKIQALCRQRSEGSMRDLTLSSNRYNQHLTAHSILLEVGAAGNSLEEAVVSAEFFADCLTELIFADES